MKVFGLTGGIGMGKSAVADLLRQRGATVVDTDVLARNLVEPGQPALAEIAKTFGADLVGTDGRLRRDALAQRVFSDENARKKLEAILHPRIRAVWLAETERWRKNGKGMGVVVIPLLYETNVASHFDVTICVACSPATQQKRLSSRGWSVEQIQNRTRSQLPIDKKMAAADYVIWNESDLEAAASQLDRILKAELVL